MIRLEMTLAQLLLHDIIQNLDRNLPVIVPAQEFEQVQGLLCPSKQRRYSAKVIISKHSQKHFHAGIVNKP